MIHSAQAPSWPLPKHIQFHSEPQVLTIQKSAETHKWICIGYEAGKLYHCHKQVNTDYIEQERPKLALPAVRVL